MKINIARFRWIHGLLFFIIICTGCAGPNLYSINMYYDAEKAVIPNDLQTSVKSPGTDISVSEFTDNRQMDNQLMIGRVLQSDGSRSFVFPKSVKATKSVSNGIKNYLKKAGHKVTERLEQWNTKESDIPKGDSRLLIGGNIEELEINCRKGFFSNSYTGNIKLNIFFADTVKGKILYSGQVASHYYKETSLFSENMLEEEADIILGDAIEKFFEDKVVSQKFKEALGK